MTKEIMKKYGINFQNRIYNREIYKLPGSNNVMCITALLFEWTSVSDINDGLLVDIDKALADPNSEIQSGSTPVSIIIHQDVVDFYPAWSDGVTSMPTTDLREIILGWRDFLLTPPLVGADILLPINICYLAVSKFKNIFR